MLAYIIGSYAFYYVIAGWMIYDGAFNSEEQSSEFLFLGLFAPIVSPILIFLLIGFAIGDKSK